MAAAVNPCPHAFDSVHVCTPCRAQRKYKAKIAADPKRMAHVNGLRRTRNLIRRVDPALRELDRERNRTRSLRYYARHRDHVLRYRSGWVRKHSDQARAWTAARRARKRGMGSSRLNWALLRLDAMGTCYLCGTAMRSSERTVRRLRETVDHIVPLGPGRHEYENCAIVHCCCNAAKRRRLDVQRNVVPGELRSRCLLLVELARKEVVA